MTSVRRALVAILLALAGCSSSGTEPAASTDDAFTGAAYTVVTSDSGQIAIAVRTSPQPPARGTIAVGLAMTDGSGAPIDGLDVAVRPWMPSMGHGTPTTPIVRPEGSGRYLVTDVNLFMAGRWELDVTIAGTRDDHAAIELDVP